MFHVSYACRLLNLFISSQVKEIKNGRLAMIAIGGITHHYFLTGKGPIEFITQVRSRLIFLFIPVCILFVLVIKMLTLWWTDPQLQVMRRRRHPDWTLRLKRTRTRAQLQAPSVDLHVR